ncbi:S24 family peptidase [Croceicoccus sp. Ery15]|uniref:S24 family peptidase n=1 Tax=Croceicoccus sp. Ery15 TaxID=1703338 RepID=UPI001E2EE267|nr:S24 family peptidase [Croceicoccus sp. Ery15]
MLLAGRQSWELMPMSEADGLRGRALYEALMQIKPVGLAETEWATQAGVNRGFFTNLKASDISPRSDTLRKLLRHIGRNEADLYTLPQKDMAEASPTPPVPDDIVQIQKLDLSLSMGPGTLIDEYVEAEPVSFDLAFIQAITRSPSNRLKLVTGIGESMYPTLNWGDAILIDTTDKQLAKQDGIYWIDLYGAAGIKRLRTVGPGRVDVISDNPAVPNQTVDASDLRIEGRAIWVARGL